MSLNTQPLLSLYAWQREGSCYGLEVNDFFAEPVKRKLRRERDAKAKELCATCPVIKECLAHALRVPETFGIWGGTTPEERSAMGMSMAS